MFPKVVPVVPMRNYSVYVYFEDGKRRSGGAFQKFKNFLPSPALHYLTSHRNSFRFSSSSDCEVSLQNIIPLLALQPLHPILSFHSHTPQYVPQKAIISLSIIRLPPILFKFFYFPFSRLYHPDMNFSTVISFSAESKRSLRRGEIV